MTQDLHQNMSRKLKSLKVKDCYHFKEKISYFYREITEEKSFIFILNQLHLNRNVLLGHPNVGWFPILLNFIRVNIRLTSGDASKTVSKQHVY